MNNDKLFNMGPKKHFTKEFVNEWSPRREFPKNADTSTLPYRSESSFSSREQTSLELNRPITDPGTPRGHHYVFHPDNSDRKLSKHHGRNQPLPLSKKPNLLLRGWQPEINERRKDGEKSNVMNDRKIKDVEKPLLKDISTKMQHITHDDVIFTESPSHPGSYIVYRLDAAKKLNPDKLYLDRRKLSSCPIIEGEDNLRLLNLQHNLINRIQRLSCLRRLIFLDLYDNEIEEIIGISTLKSLRVLMLGKNRIKRIENLQELKRLDVLDLHGNKISKIENLSHLIELRVLNLAGNQITHTGGLAGLTSLTELNLRRNKISKLGDMLGLPLQLVRALSYNRPDRTLRQQEYEIDSLLNLQRLFLSFNNISSVNDINCLSGATSLVELSLDENEFRQHLNYRQNVLKIVTCLQQLDMVLVTAEERKIANVMSKKDEEKRKEANKRASLKEQRKAVIDNAHKVWISDHSQIKNSDYQGDDIIRKSLQTDHINECAIANSLDGKVIARQDHLRRCNPCHLAEIDGNILSIYGDGALDAIERNWGERSIAMVTTAAFTYVSFDELIPYFQKLKNRFVSVVLNAFGSFHRLDNISINEDGNPVTKLSLWKSYLLFQLSHLSLKTINALEITFAERQHAEHLFEPLGRLNKSSFTSKHTLENCSVKPKHKTLSNQEIYHLSYTPKNAMENEAQNREQRETFSKYLMNEMTHLSYLTYKKQSVLDDIWPKLLYNTVQDITDDLLNSKDYGKISLQSLLKEC